MLVPKVATDEMVRAGLEAKHRGRKMATVYAAMLAAAPPCRVVELPVDALRECLAFARQMVDDEIERRAKTLA